MASQDEECYRRCYKHEMNKPDANLTDPLLQVHPLLLGKILRRIIRTSRSGIDSVGATADAIMDLAVFSFTVRHGKAAVRERYSQKLVVGWVYSRRVCAKEASACNLGLENKSARGWDGRHKGHGTQAW